MPIQDVFLKTCWKQWTIGRAGKRGPGSSVLMVRRDDNDIHQKKTKESTDQIIVIKTIKGECTCVKSFSRNDNSSTEDFSQHYRLYE